MEKVEGGSGLYDSPELETGYLVKDISKYESMRPDLSEVNQDTGTSQTSGIFQSVSKRIQEGGQGLGQEKQPLNLLSKMIFILFLALTILIVIIIYQGSVYGNPIYDRLINDPWISTFGIASFLLAALLLRRGIMFSFVILLFSAVIILSYYTFEFLTA